jgi:hypothetical protein
MPTTIDLAPTPPDTARPLTFASDASAFAAWMAAMPPQFNAVIATILAGTSSAGLALNLADHAAGNGASLVGLESAGTVQQYIMGRTSVLQFGADASGVTSSRLAFQNAIAYLTSLGGGVLTGPAGTYLFDTSSEATCLLCTVPITFDFPPGTIIKFGYYDLPLVNFVGCTGGGIKNVRFIFTGTRPASATGLTNNHFGYNAAGQSSNPDMCAFIGGFGSSNLLFDGVSWEGLATTNNKEIGIVLFGGTSTGPSLDGGTVFIPGANAVYSTGNRIINCTSNDVFFGIIENMQDNLTVDKFTSRRYKQAAFVGPGHAIYVTGHTQNSRFTNLVDTGEWIDTPGSTAQVGTMSFQFRSINRCIVSNLRSSRPEGIMSFLQNSNDNIVDGLHWSADRVMWETGLVATAALIVAQTDSVSTQNRNQFSNVYLNDLLNAGAARSANCPLVGNSSATVVSANMVQNVWTNINITYSPDASFGKSTCLYQGQNSFIEYKLTNLGTGITKSLMQLTGVAATSLAGNTVHWHVLGSSVTTFNLSMTNSAGSNNVYIHASGNVSQQNSSTGAVAGDRIFTDQSMYSTRADLINNVASHNVIHTLSANLTIPTPAAGLTFVGSVLDFTLNATGVFTVTYPASFRVAANGAAAAGKSASTRLVCTDATTPIWVQQGGALTFN